VLITRPLINQKMQQERGAERRYQIENGIRAAISIATNIEREVESTSDMITQGLENNRRDLGRPREESSD
jgi:hypothetical protein